MIKYTQTIGQGRRNALKILFSKVIAVVMLWLCAAPGISASAQSTGKCTVKGVSLTLTGNIGVDFFIEMDSQSCVTSFDLDGPQGKKTVSAKDLRPVENGGNKGCYKLSYSVSAQQGSQRITLRANDDNGICALYRSDGEKRFESDKASFSVIDYIVKVKGDSRARKALKELADALDTYVKSSPQENDHAREKYENAKENYRRMLLDGSKADSIDIKDTDGQGRNYTFEYNAQQFKAEFSYRIDGKENWRIYDSYLIRSRSDMIMICDRLLTLHKIHGRDMVSYRTAEDMADEWEIHNSAYDYLPQGDMKNHAKDVDFDPDDQGKSLGDFMLEKIKGK